ncbi:MAG TPA: hypothetical protein PK325_10850 [Cyclobacteriaceae bacterium]|nr:hypothetical protein [Cyclobacteriaceae bacterium]HMV08770.1 hypothetical protein [Cyclobacteriaceae bacterium]HMW99915.1 hypothetical protein [Cyclobacteriaceae bacterium]HMX49222.1 hypothetical protein [Cyclobacteriaceae bacterium]HMY92736.1 hypothetical protein [Cyclobacteriaceae bacterium]
MEQLYVMRDANSGRKYLGVMQGHLVEVPDSHPSVTSLLPDFVNFRKSESPARFGRNRRLVITNYEGTFLAIVKSGRSSSRIKTAKLIAYVNNSSKDTSYMLRTMIWLVSFRWRDGFLVLDRRLANNLEESLKSEFIKYGFRLSGLTGTGLYEIRLPK